MSSTPLPTADSKLETKAILTRFNEEEITHRIKQSIINDVTELKKWKNLLSNLKLENFSIVPEKQNLMQIKLATPEEKNKFSKNYFQRLKKILDALGISRTLLNILQPSGDIPIFRLPAEMVKLLKNFQAQFEGDLKPVANAMTEAEGKEIEGFVEKAYQHIILNNMQGDIIAQLKNINLYEWKFYLHFIGKVFPTKEVAATYAASNIDNQHICIKKICLTIDASITYTIIETNKKNLLCVGLNARTNHVSGKSTQQFFYFCSQLLNKLTKAESLITEAESQPKPVAEKKKAITTHSAAMGNSFGTDPIAEITSSAKPKDLKYIPIDSKVLKIYKLGSEDKMLMEPMLQLGITQIVLDKTTLLQSLAAIRFLPVQQYNNFYGWQFQNYSAAQEFAAQMKFFRELNTDNFRWRVEIEAKGCFVKLGFVHKSISKPTAKNTAMAQCLLQHWYIFHIQALQKDQKAREEIEETILLQCLTNKAEDNEQLRNILSNLLESSTCEWKFKFENTANTFIEENIHQKIFRDTFKDVWPKVIRKCEGTPAVYSVSFVLWYQSPERFEPTSVSHALLQKLQDLLKFCSDEKSKASTINSNGSYAFADILAEDLDGEFFAIESNCDEKDALATISPVLLNRSISYSLDIPRVDTEILSPNFSTEWMSGLTVFEQELKLAPVVSVAKLKSAGEDFVPLWTEKDELVFGLESEAMERPTKKDSKIEESAQTLHSMHFGTQPASLSASVDVAKPQSRETPFLKYHSSHIMVRNKKVLDCYVDLGPEIKFPGIWVDKKDFEKLVQFNINKNDDIKKFLQVRYKTKQSFYIRNRRSEQTRPFVCLRLDKDFEIELRKLVESLNTFYRDRGRGEFCEEVADAIDEVLNQKESALPLSDAKQPLPTARTPTAPIAPQKSLQKKRRNDGEPDVSIVGKKAAVAKDAKLCSEPNPVNTETLPPSSSWKKKTAVSVGTSPHSLTPLPALQNSNVPVAALRSYHPVPKSD